MVADEPSARASYGYSRLVQHHGVEYGGGGANQHDGLDSISV